MSDLAEIGRPQALEKDHMSPQLTILKSLVLGAIFLCCSAHSVELQQFSAGDEWTFLQSRTEAGQADTANEIRFSMLFKKKNGDIVLGWTKAIADAGQVVWQPIESLPQTICLRDFVGRTNLDLVNSCNQGLKVGVEWKSRIDADGVQEQIEFVATGEEVLNVAAGTFHAIKIQGKGQRTSPRNRPENLAVTYWFGSQAKAMVRSVREYRTPDGALIMRITDELTAVKVK